MKVSLIAACSTNKVIGNNNTIPWKSKVDLYHFKTLTMNKPVIMGKNTFYSLKKPLTDRINIVLSKNPEVDKVPNYSCKSSKTCGIVLWASSIDDALFFASKYNNECFVIGGASIYEQFVQENLIDEYHITIISGVYVGDTFLPNCIQAPINSVYRSVFDETGKELTFLKWNR